MYSLIFSLIFFSLISLTDLVNDFVEISLWKWLFIVLISLSFIYLLVFLSDKRHEIFFLVLITVLGSFIVIISDHLILTYIGLELQTFSIFILISKNKFNIKGSEASLKYFVLGALSSGFFLFSTSLLYFNFNILNLSNIGLINNENLLFYFLVTILILSLFFKLALFPIHFWIADIYEGCPSDVLGFLGIISKVSVLSLVIQLNLPFSYLFFLGLGSIIIGALGGLNQTKIKRLLGYSGISHMGLIFLSLSILKFSNNEISTLYLVIYMITLLGVFNLLNTKKGELIYLAELSSISINNFILSISWLLLFLSMAGIPPLCGFLSKWWVFWFLIDNGFIVLSIISILFSAIGVAYYLRVVKLTYFEPKSSFIIWNNVLNHNKLDYLQNLLLGVIIYFNVLLIINPSFIIYLVGLSFL